MLVPEGYRNCVVFLSQPDESGTQVPRGTGFLVADPLGSGDPPSAVHLVTARHVLEKARSKNKPLFARGRSNDGTVASQELDFDAWHVSAATDVAVHPNVALEGFAGECLTFKNFAMDDYLTKQDVGPGDEVFFVGLFRSFFGKDGHEPIVRFGNISMLPREHVVIKNADGSTSRVRAYLIEARSWGGQSGSPAFVWLSPIRSPWYIELPKLDLAGVVPQHVMPKLLGLVSGHFDLRQDAAFQSEHEEADGVVFNTGVAIVIPATDIAAEIRLVSGAAE